MTLPDDNMPMTKPPRSAARSLFGTLIRLGLPVLILGAGLAAYYSFSGKSEEAKRPQGKKQTIRTRVSELRTRDYPVVIKTHGVLQAHNEVTLTAQVSGEIVRVMPEFEVGSYFTEGEVLVELDESDYKTAVAVAEAQKAIAKSTLEIAESNHTSHMRLFSRSFVSQAELDRYSAARDQAVASLDAADAQLKRAKLNLERTKVRAPFDGRVLEKDVGLGQSIGSGTQLGVVFAVDFAEVRLAIAAQDLKYISLPEKEDDSPLEVDLHDGLNDESETIWKAKIVRTEGALHADSLELIAIARVIDPFGIQSGLPPLRIGQPVTGLITGKTLSNVVALPRAAVRQLDQVVLISSADLTLRNTTIVPIWSDEEFIIVRDPLLYDGALLALTHIVYAPDGAKVEIIPDIGEPEPVPGTDVEPNS